MDVHQLVLSKIAIEKTLGPLLDNSITRAFFPDPEERRVFDTIIEHNREYGRVPGLVRLGRYHPNYEFVEVDEGWPELIDDLREFRAVAILESAVSRAVENLDSGSGKVKDILSAALAQVEDETSASREVVWQEGVEERIKLYREYAENPGLKGIPCGFKTIDDATLGFQPGQLITLAGPPKSGKTTLVLLLVYAALLDNKSVLLFSFEMGAQELFEILDAIHARVSVSLLRSGDLTGRARDRLEQKLRELQETFKARLTVIEDPDSVLVLSGVAAKIVHHRPDAVFIDGIYLLEDESGGERGTPRAIRNVTQATKRLTRRLMVPIIITTQMNEHKKGKGGYDQAAVFGSQSYTQDSDVLIILEPTNDPTVARLKIGAARQAARVSTHIRLDRENSIFEEIDYDPTADEDDLDRAFAA